jgi:hypothetical protein
MVELVNEDSQATVPAATAALCNVAGEPGKANHAQTHCSHRQKAWGHASELIAIRFEKNYGSG